MSFIIAILFNIANRFGCKEIDMNYGDMILTEISNMILFGLLATCLALVLAVFLVKVYMFKNRHSANLIIGFIEIIRGGASI